MNIIIITLLVVFLFSFLADIIIKNDLNKSITDINDLVLNNLSIEIDENTNFEFLNKIKEININGQISDFSIEKLNEDYVCSYSLENMHKKVDVSIVLEK